MSLDANLIKTQFPEIWNRMVKYGENFQQAQQNIAMQKQQTQTIENDRKQALTQQCENLIAEIENDYENDRADYQQHKAELLDAINQIDTERQNALNDIEATKAEILSNANKQSEAQQKWIDALAGLKTTLSAVILEFQQATKIEYEQYQLYKKEVETYNKMTHEYNLKTIEMQKQHSEKIAELNRMTHNANRRLR